MIIVEAFGPLGWGPYEFDQNELRPSNHPPEAFLLPGFVDLHIHGAFGIDFMSATPADILVLADKLQSKGYAAFLPTTVTASAPDVLRAVNNLPDHPLIPGFHLEGPFISPQYPGAQPPEAILDIPQSPSTWDEIFDHPKLRYITLAPEKPGALELARRLVGRNVTVSLGHTAATYDEVQKAVQAGVTNATHTYNAMRGLHHREPGALGAVLTLDELTAEIIYDLHHVSRPAAELLRRSKPSEKVVAVSDCTAAHGLPPGTEVQMWGHQATVGQNDVRLTGTDTLAGSASTLLECWQNLAADFSPELATLWTCLNPRKILSTNIPERTILISPQFEILSIA